MQNHPSNINLVFILLILLWHDSATSSALSREELEEWFEDDSRSQPFSTDDVNEGELELLATPPEKPVLHSDNRLTIHPTSLQDGWVSMYQCYEHLDAVKDAQIVYQYKTLRNLKVEHTRHIEKAWVEGQSVQLHNTQKNATLCVSAEVHIFYKNADGSYTLKNGPFQRRFLDGYYPMHIILLILYPSELLRFSSSIPAKQPGFSVNGKPGTLQVDAWFEGKLFTEMLFHPK